MITIFTIAVNEILGLFIGRLDLPEWLEWLDTFYEKVCDFWLGLI